MTHYVLHTLGWLACVVYSTIPTFWLMIHPRVDYWRSRRSPYRVLLPIWIGTWVVIGAASFHWRNLVLYDTPWAWLPAVIIFSLGVWLYKQSSKTFSWTQLGGLPELMADHHEQRLMTDGIRARVRHPVYLAHLCEMLAWSVGTGLAVCYGLVGFAVLTGAIMLRTEDAELERRFGAEYAIYRAKVPALIPRLYKREPQTESKRNSSQFRDAPQNSTSKRA